MSSSSATNHAQARPYSLGLRGQRGAGPGFSNCTALGEFLAGKPAAEKARRAPQRADAARSAVLAAINHDLRQPLQAMRLFHEILKAKAGPKLYSVIDGLDEAMSQAENVLSNFLDLSVLDAGVGKPRQSCFPIDSVLAEIADEYASVATAARLRLRRVCSNAVVFSDRVLLKRLIGCLVNNAFRYTREGGVLLGCRYRGGRLIIQVVDTGIGIADNQVLKVFDDFFQVGNQSLGNAQGLGLGLAVARRLSTLLGHPISATSRIDKGSIFSIELGLAAKPANDLGSNGTVSGQARIREHDLVEVAAIRRGH